MTRWARAVLAVVVTLTAWPQDAEAARFESRIARDFDDYFTRCGPGWNGGDSGYSFALGGALTGKVAWFWSDTYLGYVRGDRTRDGRRDLTEYGLPPFVRNSITIQPSLSAPVTDESPDGMVTLFGAGVGQEAQQVPSFPARSSSFPAFSSRCYEPQKVYRSLITTRDEVAENYWAGDGVVEPSGELKVILRRMRIRSMFDIQWRGNHVATFTPTASGSLRLDSVVAAPSSRRAAIRWGAATLSQGRYVYVYGVHESARTRRNQLHVARVPAGSLQDRSAWRFWGGKGFTRRENASSPVGTGVDHEFSVVRAGGRHVLASFAVDQGLNRTPNLHRWTSRSPAGPFRRGAVLYRAPGNRRGSRLFSYSAHVHPLFTRGRDWLVSYSVLGPDHVLNVENYRPRFVRIRDIGR